MRRTTYQASSLPVLLIFGLLIFIGLYVTSAERSIQGQAWDSSSELHLARHEFAGTRRAKPAAGGGVGGGVRRSGLEASLVERQALENEREAVPLWHGAFGGSRALLGLPTSRRERLAISNKEKARKERRARARVRRENLEQLESEALAGAKERAQGRSRDETTVEHDQARRPMAKQRGSQKAAGEALRAQADMQTAESLPAHAFGEEGVRSQLESGAKKEAGVAKGDPAEARASQGEGKGAAHDETLSGAFDDASKLPANVQLGGLAFDDADAEQEAAAGMEEASDEAEVQAAEGGADLPGELGGESDPQAAIDSTADAAATTARAGQLEEEVGDEKTAQS